MNCSQNAVAVEPIKFFNCLETSTVPVLENFKMQDNICSPYISYMYIPLFHDSQLNSL